MAPHAYAFRPMTATDLAMVRRWLEMPHVAQWWGDPHEQFDSGQRQISISRPWTSSSSTRGGRPFAYLQCYDPTAWPDNGLGAHPGGTRGIDQFIGEADMIDRGHGSAFIRAFVDSLLAAGAPRVITDPDPANARAIRPTRKPAFTSDRLVDTPGRPRASHGTRRMTDFSPREIVSELDRFIVGQDDAKRAVAIALRNRWRRQQLDDRLREEVLPKNILMIGPTGVGKTEISRRLAKLAGAPFLKVEATKFTEVGYVGRDVEQIVRDLVEVAHRADAREEAQGRAGARRSRRPRSACSMRWSAPTPAPRPRESLPQASCAPASSTTRRSRSRCRPRRRHADVRDPRHAGRADGRDLDRRHFRQARRRAHQDAARHRARIPTRS